ncbi:MAG: HlyD family efflux transporter periplasmic adaptor subunit [Planctomycetaceae bacterium]
MTDEWLPAFESRLEQLEQKASGGVSIAKLAEECRDTLCLAADVPAVELVLVRHDDNSPDDAWNGSVERLADAGTIAIALPDDAVLQASSQRTSIISATEWSRAESSLAECSLAESSSARGAATCADPDLSVVVLSTPVGDNIRCTMLVAASRLATDQSLTEAGHAVLSVVAEHASRQLVTESESRLRQQRTMTALAVRLSDCSTVPELAAAIAHSTPAVLGDCRVSLLERNGTACRVIAVSGVQKINPAAASVRAIEAIAGSAATSCASRWIDVDEPANEPEIERATEVLASNSVSRFRVLPLSRDETSTAVSQPQSEQDHNTPKHVLVVEAFTDTAAPCEPVLQELVQICRQRLRAIVPNANPRTSGRRRLIGASGAVAVVVLLFWPVRFEIETTGQLSPKLRQRVFAPEDGVVQAVPIQQDQHVSSHSVLLELSNADLQLQQRQLQGEIDTVGAQLAAARTARLTGSGNESPAGLETRQSSDEQLLELRLNNLNERRQLLLDRISALRIEAPVDGMVFRREPLHELISRPVQRGQLLLEIVPDNEPWQLELRISDAMIGYLNSHRRSTDQPVTVRYLLRARPDERHDATLTTVDSAIQLIDGQLTCIARADVAESADSDLRPGTSVTARIDCGRRPLGFVIFREVIEFLQQVSFAWL